MLERLAKLLPEVVVVSGGARGVDREAEAQARSLGLDTLILSADWDRYGKRAGPIRNQVLVDTVDIVVAFWDGVSRGTKDTITRAQDRGVPVIVIL